MKYFLAALAFAALGSAVPNASQAQQGLRTGVPAGSTPYAEHDSKTNTDKGICIDIMNALASDIGHVQFVSMPLGDLIPSLNANKIDVIAANLIMTPERAQQVAFTTEVFTGTEGVVASKTDPTEYESLNDFKGLTVGAQTGSIYVDALRKVGADIKTFPTTEDILREVDAGHIKAGLSSGTVFSYFVSQGGFPNVRVVKTYQPVFSNHIGFAVRKTDTELLRKLNMSLAKIQSNGTLKAIFAKYGQ